jgi:glycosyltransferase involved in cell wall biosynthesis
MSISVAMATCNGAKHLREQLRSIAGQTHPPDELVVSDDASEDQTLAVVREFAGSVPFPVVVIENAKRLGVTGNFTHAIKRCTGEWIAPADQDDVWLPEKLASLLVACDDPGVGLVFSDVALCDRSGGLTGATQWGSLGFGRDARKRSRRDPFDALLRFNVVTGMSMMMRTSLRELVLPIPDGWVHDEWVALLASAVGDVRFIDRPLVHYRQHTDQQIGGAVSGVMAQLRYARLHMNAAYMNGMARRSRQAADRLSVDGLKLRRLDAAHLLRQRAEHYTRRVDPRLGMVWRDWRSGAYSRFGYGLKGVLQDLLLR